MHNLPTQLTSFIGRERERALLRERLSSARLVTLTGAGGAGKTRLALALAANLEPEFEHGVWLVELAALTDPAVVPSAITVALGVRGSAERSTLESLLEYLSERQILLVLDNCEHLVAGCAELADQLLRLCPGVRILATSRETLNVPGEVIWRVPSLALDSEAVQLFAERARAALPDFEVTSDNAAAVAEVCQRLDGIPLAIELAAARIRTLTPMQIAARLDDRFGLLVAGPRTVLPRQQTLRATVDWSYALLSEAERMLFRSLFVFAGGWTLDAADLVCGNQPGVLRLLEQLVNRSLVQATPWKTETRYRLLETLRQYAAEKAHEADEDVVLRERHLDWFVALAERAQPGLRTSELPELLDRLEAEHDNIRAALRWAAEQRPEAQVRLSDALWEFWYIRGYLAEGQFWLDAAAQRTDVSLAVRARALKAAGSLASYRYDFDRAASLETEALALAQQIGDMPVVAACLVNLGNTDAGRKRYASAGRWYAQALRLMRELDDSYGVGLVLVNQSYLARYQGQHARATQLLEQCLPLFVASGDRRRTARTLMRLGTTAYEQSDYARAEQLGRDALATFGELGFTPGIADCFELLASVAAAQGSGARAARLFGALEALQERIGRSLSPAERPLRERGLVAMRRVVGELSGARWRTDGQLLSLDAAIAFALSDATLDADAAPLRPLSARERDVVALIADGLTNRQIAERLIISERTVDSHVSRIFNKLGLNTRAQAAVWAAAHGLN
ncbi:MAG TPA: LuxR C-terminal-related transcriptional regulator [Chloroflexota bacterium]